MPINIEWEHLLILGYPVLGPEGAMEHRGARCRKNS